MCKQELPNKKHSTNRSTRRSGIVARIIGHRDDAKHFRWLENYREEKQSGNKKYNRRYMGHRLTSYNRAERDQNLLHVSTMSSLLRQSEVQRFHDMKLCVIELSKFNYRSMIKLITNSVSRPNDTNRWTTKWRIRCKL